MDGRAYGQRQYYIPPTSSGDNNKGADQPALPRSLVSAFDIRYLEWIVVNRTCVNVRLVFEAPKTGFSRRAHFSVEGSMYTTSFIISEEQMRNDMHNTCITMITDSDNRRTASLFQLNSI